MDKMATREDLLKYERLMSDTQLTENDIDDIEYAKSQKECCCCVLLKRVASNIAMCFRCCYYYPKIMIFEKAEDEDCYNAV